jgi:hypothetical protein
MKEVRKLEAEKAIRKGLEVEEKKEDTNAEEEEKPVLRKVSKKKGKDRVRVIDLKWASDSSYENSEHVPGMLFEKMCFWRIKESCKLYKSFCMSGTNMIVAHGSFVSIFSVVAEDWVHHFFY